MQSICAWNFISRPIFSNFGIYSLRLYQHHSPIFRHVHRFGEVFLRVWTARRQMKCSPQPWSVHMSRSGAMFVFGQLMKQEPWIWKVICVDTLNIMDFSLAAGELASPDFWRMYWIAGASLNPRQTFINHTLSRGHLFWSSALIGKFFSKVSQYWWSVRKYVRSRVKEVIGSRSNRSWKKEAPSFICLNRGLALV